VVLELVVRTLALLVEVVHLRGQAPDELERAPLGVGERGALVQPRVVQEQIAP
jgi:hypothetical protein